MIFHHQLKRCDLTESERAYGGAILRGTIAQDIAAIRACMTPINFNTL
jgi:hypothetical protein